ncbi:hypothetical protein [Streptomyces fagopyri]|uniref:hypothetical protein n=1 Tax=Streptomyces fagopyri TaxID=2662397 RepID=UPI003720D4CA
MNLGRAAQSSAAPAGRTLKEQEQDAVPTATAYGDAAYGKGDVLEELHVAGIEANAMKSTGRKFAAGDMISARP